MVVTRSFGADATTAAPSDEARAAQLASLQQTLVSTQAQIDALRAGSGASGSQPAAPSDPMWRADDGVELAASDPPEDPAAPPAPVDSPTLLASGAPGGGATVTLDTIAALLAQQGSALATMQEHIASLSARVNVLDNVHDLAAETGNPTTGQLGASPAANFQPPVPAAVFAETANDPALPGNIAPMQSQEALPSGSLPGSSLLGRPAPPLRTPLPTVFKGMGKGQDARQWLVQLIAYFQSQQQPRAKWVSHLPAFFAEDAAAWWTQHLLNAQGGTWTWNQFETEFLQQFVDPTEAEKAAYQLLTLQQHKVGGTNAYAVKFRMLAQKLTTWSRESLIAQFIRNLHPSVKPHLIARTFSTLDEAVVAANQFDLSLAQSTKTASGSSSGKDPSGFKSAKSRPSKDAAPSPHTGPFKPNPRHADLRCNICNEKGHISPDCHRFPLKNPKGKAGVTAVKSVVANIRSLPDAGNE